MLEERGGVFGVQGFVARQAVRRETPGMRIDGARREGRVRAGFGINRRGRHEGLRPSGQAWAFGHLVDPDNHRDEELDLGVIGGKLAGVGRHLPAAYARVVIEAEGYLLKWGPLRGAVRRDSRDDGYFRASRNELLEGSTADIALFEALEHRSRCVLGIRVGHIVWNTEGLSIPDVSRAGPYSNFK